MCEFGKFLFQARMTPLKWIAIVPGLIALLFLGHAFEDAGFVGALPYIAILAISVAYLFRPTVVLWIALFGLFASYAGLIALSTEEGLLNEGFIIVLIPAILMLFAWPMKLEEAD